MRLSLVALCLSVSVVSSAFSDIDEIIRFRQTIVEFQASLEARFDHDENKERPEMMGETTELQVWFAAKYHNTHWSSTDSLLLDIDLLGFVPSITLADNPAFLEQVSPEIYQTVMRPDNLAAYDAANLAKTLPNLDELANINLDQFNAVKIVELLNTRKSLDFDLPLAMENNDIPTLDLYITNHVWMPTQNDIIEAVTSKSQMCLLYLLRKLARMPSASCIDLLIKNGRIDAIDCIRSSYPDWKPSQCDIDDAVYGRCSGTLSFYVSITPDMPPPSRHFVGFARLSEYWNIIEFCLGRWPEYCSDALGTSLPLMPRQITIITLRGYANVLKWAANVHPKMFRPSNHSLKCALERKHFKVLEWRASVAPAWAVDPEQINAAAIRGDVEILDWYGDCNPEWNLSAETIDAAICNGHYNVRAWALNRSAPHIYDKMEILLGLVEELGTQ